jgi:uncharacterized SAM-binding protein YcdF (DUF218 family)
MIVAGYFAFFSKKNIRQKRGKTALIAIGLIFSNTVLFKEVCRQWEVFSPKPQTLTTYDVGIVLTGMGEYNNDLKVFSARRGIDRIWQAISLYKSGKIAKILITGDHGYLFDKGLHEAVQIKEVLVHWGIPENDILTETKSKNTYENAIETKKMLSIHLPNAKKILLITSGKHMRRSRACFAKANLTVDTYSTDLYTGPNRYYTFDEYIIPDVSTMSDWHGLLKEMVGYIAYDITGKI